MASINAADANAWSSPTKLALTDPLDTALEAQVSAEVLSRIGDTYDTSTWTGPSTTPILIKKIIAMMYVGWYYQRTYSEDEDTNSYGLLLIAQAERLLVGIEAGDITVIGGLPSTADASQQSTVFYPTDASSASSPTLDDMSLGGPKFTMGTIW
jgi:hypothetical protein